MAFTVSILTIGSELLDGRVQDTNSQYICAELARIGIQTGHILTCDDNLPEIVRSLKFLSAECSAIIVSGGLGPTNDDLTREAIAEFAERKLQRDEESLNQIKAMFERRNRKFEPANEKQAFFPEGALIIANQNGTAPGFKISKPAVIYSVPGVPSELKPMFTGFILPDLHKLAGEAPGVSTGALKVFGVAEAAVGARVSKLEIPSQVSVSYRALFPEIHVLFKTRDTSVDLAALVKSAADAIGSEYVFSTDPASGFEDALHKLLTERNLTVATAESCTGGMAAEILTSVPGASKYFLGAAVVYANAAKSALLAVDENVIKREGAVSYATAKLMAANCREKFSCDIAVSITGIAGPDGGTAEKPVGLFFVGLATRASAASFRYLMPSSRQNIRRYAAYMALDAVRRNLLGLRIYPEYDPAKSI